MAGKAHPLAQALLDAHIAYLREQLNGDALQGLLETEVDHLLELAGEIRLNEAVTRYMIKDTVRVYAVELELSGAIPELVGDIARGLHAHPIHADTTLGDLIPDGLFAEFLDKILEMRELRERLVHEAVANPVYAALASDVVLEGIRGYAQQGMERARRLPAAGRAVRVGQSLLGSALPMLEEGLEEGLRKYMRRSLEEILQRSEDFLLDHFDEEKIRELVLDVWDLLKEKRIASIKSGITSLDLEEFFVIGYETWRELRLTPFYIALIDSGIDSFFDKYGETTLSDLLDEVGITRDIAMREAMRFAPPVIAMLERKQLLEPILRRNLEGFYQSSAVTKILGETAAAKAPAKKAAKAEAPEGAEAVPKKPARKKAPAEKKAAE
ncbi:MAG: hypothetical protein REI12_04010 [Pedobacter sp.]|nr:hypothetical protein [Pedobacter sp.]